jgi:hypothetical protein
MPEWASRLRLRVTDVRVENVAEISEEDAIAEGVDPLFTAKQVSERPELGCDPMPWLNYMWHGHFGQYGTGSKFSDSWPHQYSSYKQAKDSFSSAWYQRYGRKHPWESTWVVVVTFERR